MWKKTMILGLAQNLRTNCAKTMGTMSPTLSKKIPTPSTIETVPPPKAGVSLTCRESEEVVRRWLGWKRSCASDFHWFSLPKRQRTKMNERMEARRMVNHAPTGIFVRAELRNTPST